MAEISGNQATAVSRLSKTNILQEIETSDFVVVYDNTISLQCQITSYHELSRMVPHFNFRAII